MAANKFKCKVCGYIHEGNTAPDKCPVCQAPASEFEKMKSGGGLFSKNGNLYIVVYSVIMVVIVAVLLSVTSMSLQERQRENAKAERQNAILQSLGKVDDSGKATVEFKEYIAEGFAVNAEGDRVEGIDLDQAIDLLADLPAAINAGTYPVFKSKDNNYVFPVTGNGLWDIIWGYVALGEDLNTIVGVVFDHKGETPGLGAEIATKKHQDMYKNGKQIFDGGVVSAQNFTAIELVKGGAKAGNPMFSHQVDAITGGTKTSEGVTEMLKVCLERYVPFMVKTVAGTQASQVEEADAAEAADENAAEQGESAAEPVATQESNN